MISWRSNTFCLISRVQIIYEHSYYSGGSWRREVHQRDEAWLNPAAGFMEKNAGQGSARSDMADMVLITWPDVAPLYFTKPGVHWEYATVAGESARAFVCFA